MRAKLNSFSVTAAIQGLKVIAIEDVPNEVLLYVLCE